MLDFELFKLCFNSDLIGEFIEFLSSPIGLSSLSFESRDELELNDEADDENKFNWNEIVFNQSK